MIDINKLCEIATTIDNNYTKILDIRLFKNGYEVLPLHNDEQPRCDDKLCFIDFNGNILAEWFMDTMEVKEGYPLKHIDVPLKYRPSNWEEL